ncbi:Uncharacterised protein [Serratia marcescens]|nr:Uncharacterised protein [Serratia marcescens]CVC04963.1 Uncharacterised protein [Serratia marcescens]CVC11966.1 Uncharacterised protein [Serratia marcescens]CVC53909.1 Uncharacterised protein [Serratia marcescens]CVD32152.1 Uncharacterised protein [Serratia marcescens]
MNARLSLIITPLSRKAYAVWMSLTIGLSFAWLNLLDLYNNDTLFFQKLTISVINNTSFADVVASYLRLILYLPFGLLAIVLTLLFCARRLCDTRLFVLAWPISLAVFLVFWFVNVAFPGHLNLVLVAKSCVLALIGLVPPRKREAK